MLEVSVRRHSLISSRIFAPSIVALLVGACSTSSSPAESNDDAGTRVPKPRDASALLHDADTPTTNATSTSTSSRGDDNQTGGGGVTAGGGGSSGGSGTAGAGTTGGAGGSEPLGEGGLPTQGGNGGSVPEGGSSGSVPEGGSGGSVPEGGSGGISDAGTGGSGPSNLDELAFAREPTFVPNDNPRVPLAGVIQVETTVPTTGLIDVSGGGESWSLAFDGESLSHERALLGFLPGVSYEFTVSVESEQGDELSSPPISWQSPELPEDFPRLELLQSEASEMEPGMTLFDVRSLQYLVIVDSSGRVRWHYSTDRRVETARVLANGNLIYISQYLEIIEIDWLGNRVGWWYAAANQEAPEGATPVDVDRMSHSVHELPNGNLLTFDQEERVVENYPSSDEDPDAPTKTADVFADVIVEFTRSGEVVKRIPLLDVLDPTRVAHGGVSTSGLQNWSHANEIVYDANADAYLASLRLQDAIVKIDRDTEELIWILGNHANWEEPWHDRLLTPIGDLEWQFHQHAVQITEEGVSLFDNGNFGAPAFAPTISRGSRAVRYAVDEEQRTVRQVWEHEVTSQAEPIFAPTMGDADLQPTTSNVLITTGTISSGTTPPGWAQIVEVTEAGDVVFELEVRDSPNRATTYSSDRIPDIRDFTVPLQ